MADDITITIDGVEVKTQPGKMVLEAAIDAGVYIPYLCYHPGMKPFAACRLCVVAVEGGRGFPASCTLPVQEGMKIQSEAAEVHQLRRSVMEMLIAEHPDGCLTCHRVDICGPSDICLRHVSVNDRCVTCPKNERCELKDTVRYLGMELESPLEYKYRNLPLELGDPFYDRDYNLCIACGRCVRACEEIRGDNAICFTERAGTALVGTSFGTSLLESGCEFCGACIDVCPVGALVEKDHKWEKAREVRRTICPHCPVGCQLNLELNAMGRIIRTVPELNSPANRGQACFKGKFGLEFVNKTSRLRSPLIRRNGRLEEVSWDEALDYTAARLGAYKGDSFALLTSPNSTNEEHYLAQKFARVVMGTNNVDQTSNTRPELVLGLEEALGYAAGTNPIWELEQAGCILVFNSNLTEEHNVVGVPIKRAARKDTRLVVIDPREVELTRYAHCWLRPIPGTELLVLGGILKSLLDQGLERRDWLERQCQDPQVLRNALGVLDLDQIAQVTHVPAEAMAEAARFFGQAERGAIAYALDNIPAPLQRQCVHALVALALATGNLGKPGSGLYPMRQGANEQGAWDVGCLPDRLPGYRRLDDEAARREVEALWGCGLPARPGLGVAAALGAARQRRIKAMLVIGDLVGATHASPLRGGPGDGLAALEALEFLVVIDTFLSPPAQRAEVVLPRATFAEKDGTYTNLERRIQRLRPAVQLKNSLAQSERWALCQLARRMPVAGFDHPTAAAVMDEIARVTPIYAGVSYQRLEEEGVLTLRSGLESPKPTQLLYASKEYRGIQWPCPAAAAPGTPILYADGFPRGKPAPVAPQFQEPETPSNTAYPAWLAPGRVLLQPERETQVVKGKANRIVRDEVVQLNPADAARWAIGEGDVVEVSTATSRLVGSARLDDAIPPGVIARTTLFGELAVELQASQEADPMSKVPGLDILPARVAKAPPEAP